MVGVSDVPDSPLVDVSESRNEALPHAGDYLQMPGVPDSPVPDSPLVDVPESSNEASLHAADDASSPFVASPVGSPTIIPTLEKCLSYLQSKYTRDKQDTMGFMAHAEVGKTLRFIASHYSTREIILMNGEDDNDPKLVACCVCNVEGSVFNLNEAESLGYAVRTKGHKPTCTPQCAGKRLNSSRRKERKRKRTSDPADASSKVRKDYMSPQTLLRNNRNLFREINLVQTRLRRLV